jgi:SnoaL-like domain
MKSMPCEDRLEIQEVIAKYAFRIDTKRYGELSELFAEDGVWDETVIGLPLCEGRSTIHEFFSGVGDAIGFVFHMNGNHHVTAFNGATASSTVHLFGEGRFAGRDVRILGYYHDEFVKVDGAWLFARRTLAEIAPSTGFDLAAVAATSDDAAG